MEHTIGKNIYTHRTAKGYTQEALAKLLNVSNAAVSKWENGNACPDISTLPILARIFDCSVDELLKFEKNLCEEDIDRLVKETVQMFSDLPFIDAMANIRRIVREYPNSELLKVKIAGSHNTIAILLKDDEKSKEFNLYARELCEQTLTSNNLMIAQTAAVVMAPLLMREDKAEEALHNLQSLPKLQDTTTLECMLLSQMNDTDKAKAMLQQELYKNFNNMGLLLTSLMNIEGKEEFMPEASPYITLLEQLNALFHMECAGSDQLYLYYALRKDKESTLFYLKKYIQQLEHFDSQSKLRQEQLAACPWFQQVKLKDSSSQLPRNMMKGVILPMLDSMEELSFLKDDPDYQELLTHLL